MSAARQFRIVDENGETRPLAGDPVHSATPKTPKASPLFGEIKDKYLRHSTKATVHCAEALEQRQYVLNLFGAYIPSEADPRKVDEYAVDQLEPFFLEDFIESHAAWKSSSTRKAKANIVNACCNWAEEKHRIASNPFKGINYEEADPRPLLPDDVFEWIALKSNRQFSRAIRFLRLVGCRLSDLFRLEWPGVDFAAGIATVDKHKSRATTKKAKKMVLVSEAVTLLRNIANETSKDRSCPVEKLTGPVFLNNRGTPWNRRTLGQQMRRLKLKHGIDCRATLHGIRHQFGTQAVKNGARIKFVSLQMGHSSVAVTEKYYLHLDDAVDSIREAAKMAQPESENKEPK